MITPSNAHVLARYLDEPEDQLSPLGPDDILIGALPSAIKRGFVIGPWTGDVDPADDHVYLRTFDARVAVTSYRGIKGILRDLADQRLVRVHQGVFVNTTRVDKIFAREAWVVFHFPRGAREPRWRESVRLSKVGRRNLLDALDGRRLRRRLVRTARVAAVQSGA